MSLRYRLSKERFKGKKLPPKIVTNEDHISLDQRGDDSSTDKKSPLSLDKITSTISKPFEDNDISRRGLLGTLNKLKQYAEESDAKDQQILKRKKILLKDPEEEEEETAVAEEESGEAEATEPEAETAPKKGFFKRLLHRFYPPLEEPQSQPPKPEPVATDEGSSPAEEAVESLPLEEETEERVAEDIEMNRRNLIRQGVHLFAKPTIDSIQGKIDRVNETMDKITRRVPLLRPPGAISEQAFLQACTRCDKCIIACPKDAILKVPKKMGFLIMDTPYIDPVKVPCVMCTDLPCISACPDSALLPVPGGATEVEMGYAIMDKKKCQAYGDTFCQQCIIDCPIPGAITQKDERPVFHKNVCTGCGVCVRSCGTVNIPVAIKVKPQMVIEWQERKKAMAEKEAEIKAQRKAEAKAEAEALAAQEISQDAESSQDSPDPVPSPETSTPDAE